MDYFGYFNQGTIDEANTVFISIEYLASLIGFFRLIEHDGSRAHKLIGVEDGESEIGLFIMSFQDGIAVVSLLVRGDEVGVDLLFGFADFDAEGGDVLEVARFDADAIELIFFHLSING